MSVQLERLLAQATPGPWTFNNGTDPRGHKGEFRAPSPHNGFMLVGPWTNDHDARLIALAPDLARLLVDAMAALENAASANHGSAREIQEWVVAPLLARFAELEQRAAQ